MDEADCCAISDWTPVCSALMLGGSEMYFYPFSLEKKSINLLSSVAQN